MVQHICAVVLLFLFLFSVTLDSLNILYVVQSRKTFIFVTVSRYCEFSAQDKKSLLIVLGDLKCMPSSLLSEGNGSGGYEEVAEPEGDSEGVGHTRGGQN